MTPLNAALSALAEFLNLSADDLIAYASLDTLGGYSFDPEQATFPSGSLWGVEGSTLYALVRALKPATVYEFGAWRGASATHLRSAVRDNGSGEVVSVDHWAGAGDLLPVDLLPYGRFVYAEAVSTLATLPDNSVDFAFEDAIHSDTEVRDICLGLQRVLKPGGVCVHHDSEHGDDGVKVRRGVRWAGVTEYISMLIEPSDCGLLAWRKL